MPAPIHIQLTSQEDQTLQALSEANGVPRRTKQRATALRLNAQGWSVPQVARYLNWVESTVRQSISRWQRDGLAGLWDAPRPGRHPRWNDADWQAIEQWLSEPRRYSAAQLSQKLASERQVQLGAERQCAGGIIPPATCLASATNPQKKLIAGSAFVKPRRWL